MSSTYGDTEERAASFVALILSVAGLALAWHVAFGLEYMPAGIAIALPAALTVPPACIGVLTGDMDAAAWAILAAKTMLLLVAFCAAVLCLYGVEDLALLISMPISVVVWAILSVLVL